MQVGGWSLSVLVAASAAVGLVFVWPRASPSPVEGEPEARTSARPIAAPIGWTGGVADEGRRGVAEEGAGSQRARTLAAEDALAERSGTARVALIKRQRTRLQRSVASAELEDNPARARVLRRRLKDLDRMEKKPLE